MPILASVLNQLDHAIYTPALQTQYTTGVIKKNTTRKLPKGAALKDLNFFEPNSKFFNLDAGLYSAGHFKNHNNPPPCMVINRTRGTNQNTLVIGDSGGFQIASGLLGLTPQIRENIYDWLITHCDVSMTLDVPTHSIDKNQSYIYSNFNDCLDATLDHLEVFKDLGGEQQYFLNVLQGDEIKESDIWYNEVKKFNFYGWAIAGPQRKTMKIVLHRILALIEDGQFDKDETWLHFLGVGDLKSAVLLTTIRNVLRNKFPKCRIEISFDSSTPFLQGGGLLSALTTPIFQANQIKVPAHRIDKLKWAGSRAKFPYNGSEISKYLTKGDIIRKDGFGVCGPDNLGYLMLQNHNVEVQVSAIDAIHKVLKAGLRHAHLVQLIPRYLLEAQDAIEDILLQTSIKKARSKLYEVKNLKILDNAYKSTERYI